MIGRIKLLLNYKEIDRAKELGIDPPKEVFKFTEFGFLLSDVELFYITEDKDIIIQIKGIAYTIEHDSEILNSLEIKFSN